MALLDHPVAAGMYLESPQVIGAAAALVRAHRLIDPGVRPIIEIAEGVALGDNALGQIELPVVEGFAGAVAGDPGDVAVGIVFQAIAPRALHFVGAGEVDVGAAHAALGEEVAGGVVASNAAAVLGDEAVEQVIAVALRSLAVDGIAAGEKVAQGVEGEAGVLHAIAAAAGNFASYARCVDSVHTSNGKKKGEGNSKNGNKYLAWAFVEAANFALRYCPEAKRFYERKKAKTNSVVAIKALAHKLARACFHMLKERKPFDAARCFA